VTEDAIRQALDQAFLDDLREKFSRLVEGLALDSRGVYCPPDMKITPTEAFERRLAFARQAHEIAMKTVGK